VLARINDELRKALAASDIKERIVSQGAETAPMSVDEFTAFFRAEVAKWAPIIKPFAE
jgi:tripartite-type tricarboxylate transporter receptor subunit TctC